MTQQLNKARSEPPFISCVVPAYNEEAGITHFLSALKEELLKHSPRYEIVVVDDGSRDKTVETVAPLCDGHVRLLELSRNFGKEAALTAGIDHAQGDVVILIDADFQHPIEVIAQFLAEWRNGFDMVYGIRNSRDDETARKRLGAHLFYKFLNYLSSVPIPPDAGDFRLLDRKVINALKSLPERTRFMKGLYSWVGFRSTPVKFDVQDRTTGVSSFNFKSLYRLAIVGIVSFSDIPLRVWSLIGFIISAIAFAYALWILTDTLMFGSKVPGWATLSVALMFFGGVQLMSIGILGEYIAHIFNEVKQRPNYVVDQHYGYNPADEQ